MPIVKSMSSAHCWRSALHWDQPAVSGTFNRTETFWSLPTGNGTGSCRKHKRVSEMFRKCCKIAADLSQTSEFLFFVSVFSVQCGPGLICQDLPAVNIVLYSRMWRSVVWYAHRLQTFGKASAFISRIEDIKSKFRRNQDRFKTFFNPTQK